MGFFSLFELWAQGVISFSLSKISQDSFSALSFGKSTMFYFTSGYARACLLGRFVYNQANPMQVCSLELSAAYFQPASSIFLSQLKNQQYFQPFIFSQANRLRVTLYMSTLCQN